MWDPDQEALHLFRGGDQLPVLQQVHYPGLFFKELGNSHA
jgi:hypothetical protein